MSMFNALVVAVCLRHSVSISLNASSEPNTTTTSTTTIASTTFLRATTTHTRSAPDTTKLTTTSELMEVAGRCVGNDARCMGQNWQMCIFLSHEGSNCEWEWTPATTTSESTSVTGHCAGNDGRCSGKNQKACYLFSLQGADCEWEWSTPDTSKGSCSGNDSRCGESNQAACTRLAAKGSHCWWKQAVGPEGTCLGNDSRCKGSGKQMCDRLDSEGADCRWRAAFSFTGYLLLEVSNATYFVSNPEAQDAATLAIANITGLPEEFVSTYMDVDAGNQKRRLLSVRRLSTDGKVMSIHGKVILTYAGSVQGDAQSTPTGKDVSAALQSSAPEDFTSLFRSNVEDLLGENPFAVSVLDKSDVTLDLVDSSGMDASTTVRDGNPSQTETSTTMELVDSSVAPTSTTVQEIGTHISNSESGKSAEEMDAANVPARLLVHVLAFVCLLHSL